MTARVVVAGGGPAGLAAAAVLARGGVDTTLVESGRYPRHRLCGEFLSPDAARALAAIGAADVPGDAPLIDRVRVTASGPARRPAELRAPLAASGWGIARFDLDARLAAAARRAGVRLLEGRRVRSIDAGEAAVCVQAGADALRADAVVVATGRLARPAGTEERRRGTLAWVGLKTHVTGPRLPGVTELHFVAGAYAGLNEVSCGGERVVNVCALISAEFWDAAGRCPDVVWERLAAESAPFAKRWRRAIPIDGSRAAAARFGFDARGAVGAGGAGGAGAGAGNRARPPLVVGDAAAMIAPLCGDGQGMALAGGVAVARTLLAARLPDGALPDAAVRAAATAWSQRFRRESGVRLRLGRVLQGALLTPRIASAVVRLASAFRAAPRWLYLATRGPVHDAG